MVLRKVMSPGTPIVWGKQTRPYERPLDISDVPTAVATLQHNAKAPMLARGLLIRAEPDGRIRIRYAPGRNSSPPYLLGQFMPDEQGGVLLRGTIYEASTTSIMAWIFAAVALMLLLVFVGLLVTAQFHNPGLYICGLFGLLCALLGYLLLKMRNFTFQYDADHLEHGLRTLLPMSRSHRSP